MDLPQCWRSLLLLAHGVHNPRSVDHDSLDGSDPWHVEPPLEKERGFERICVGGERRLHCKLVAKITKIDTYFKEYLLHSAKFTTNRSVNCLVQCWTMHRAPLHHGVDVVLRSERVSNRVGELFGETTPGINHVFEIHSR